MRRANKQTDSCKHLIYRHKTWTNPRPMFQVLAGNLSKENRKTPTISVGVTIITLDVLSTCKFRNILNNSQR